MSRWFRWYEGTTEDGKFRVVARKSRVTVRDVIALWAFMLEDAADLEHRGVCKRDEDFMAGVLDFDDGVVELILHSMEEVGLISIGHGAITVCNFSARQFESDSDPTAAERQRRKRERDKDASNAPVTRDSRRPEDRVQNTERKKEPPDPQGGEVDEVERDFEESLWKDFPRHKNSRRFAALKAYRRLKPAERVSCLRGAARYAIRFDDDKADKRPMKERLRYVPHLSTWINEHGWETELEPA